MLRWRERKEINNPPQEQKKKKKVIFSFICLRKGFAVSSPSKTRIKGTGKKINDIVTEVLSLSRPMIFELYWWIVIRYFSLAALVSVLNAYHLVLDAGVTDRGLEMERGEAEEEVEEVGGWMEGGVWERGSRYPTEKPADFSFPISKSTHCNVSPQTGSPRANSVCMTRYRLEIPSNHGERSWRQQGFVSSG